MKRLVARVAVVVPGLLVCALATAPSSSAQPDVVTVREVVRIPVELGPEMMTYFNLCGDFCPDGATPPERYGGVGCSAHGEVTLSVSDHGGGAKYGGWSAFFATTDCVSGNADPVRMGYMFIRATVSHNGSVRATAGATTCTSSSSQCSGLTTQGADGACGPCNGSWGLTLTASWRLPERIDGGWPAPDPDGPCTRSSDRRQVDCQRTVYAGV